MLPYITNNKMIVNIVKNLAVKEITEITLENTGQSDTAGIGTFVGLPEIGNCKKTKTNKQN